MPFARTSRLALVFAVLGGLLIPAAGQTEDASPLVALETADESRGWNAVGRLNLGDRGFCTGALIAPDLVLTAAHCLFDKQTKARLDPTTIQFLAGWRNGRAAAYRNVRRGVVHPGYVYGGADDLGRVAFDLALLELDQPIRLPSMQPFQTFAAPERGAKVGVVSYAMDRAEAPSLQQSCDVLDRQEGILVLSCNVDFGSSGAPVFTLDENGRVKGIVSVVSAKAQVEGKKVALGTPVTRQLAELRLELNRTRSNAFVRPGSRNTAGGAKFLTVTPTETP